MRRFDVEQGTPEWFECRSGIVTTSCVKDVLAKGQGKTRATYMHKLMGEVITGMPTESYSNAHMERGHEQEPVAREIYSERISLPVEQCGFLRNHDHLGGVGYSPDALVGDDGLAEIKSRLPHLQVEVILSDKVPSEHIAQIQTGLWVSGRAWLDYVSYCPNMPLFVKRVFPDPAMFKTIEAGIIVFYKEMNEKLERIAAFGTK